VYDVSNAFTPNGDGVNDVIYVRGFGITKMTWHIYNRWGTLVYLGTNMSDGWDGKYNGKLQPQDVYQYTLEVEFSDKSKSIKKGDITLLK
jgi:gliding motility-associated-like protein